jgi:hypothetical protein
MAFARRKIQLDPEMKQKMESSSRNIFEVFYSTTTTPPERSLSGQVSGS